MTDAKEFLDGWFAAYYRFDGLILVLQAFFDATGSGTDEHLTAVAGFVYDKEGLTAFNEAWAPKVEALSKPYRSSACHAGKGQFGPPDWCLKTRMDLMDDLATLSADHALAAFVVATENKDYEAARENAPEIKEYVDSPYGLCAMYVLAMFATWGSHNALGKKLHYWFEAGDTGQKEAKRFIGRILAHPGTNPYFLNISRGHWESKDDVPAFCSADLLAWEWRRSVLKEEEELWTQRLKGIVHKMNCKGKHIDVENISGTKTTALALSRLLQGFK